MFACVFWVVGLGILAVNAAPQGTATQPYCQCLAKCYQGPCGTCLRPGENASKALAPSTRSSGLWGLGDHERWVDIGAPSFCQKQPARFEFSGRCYFDTESNGAPYVPWELRSLGWDCPEYCRYECARNDTIRRRSVGEPVVQYHGAWPFRRIGPFYQFWSVVFSIGNFVPHFLCVCFRRYRRRFAPLERLPPLPSGRPNRLLYPLSPVLVVHGLFGMNAWFWSTVYHTHDTKATQRMDVHCATFYVFFSFYVLVLRLFGWDPAGRVAVGFGVLLFGGVVVNFLYLDFVHWDFLYNLSITIAAVVLYAFCGFLWVFLHWRRRYAWNLGILVGLLLVAGLLEVYDFPPVWDDTLDAHALWHLATIPLTFGWYLFLAQDTQYELALAGERSRETRRSPVFGDAPIPALFRRLLSQWFPNYNFATVPSPKSPASPQTHSVAV